MKILITLCLLVPSFALADGKAYRFLFDHRLPAATCFAKAKQVAHRYGFGLRVSAPNEFQMVSADPEDTNGVAYYENGTCHVYVY